jgi:hypothetical protein
MMTTEELLEKKKELQARQKEIAEHELQMSNTIKDVKNSIHWTLLADMVSDLKKLTNMSERNLAVALNMSKTEIHRLMVIADLPKSFKFIAQVTNMEKYVLLEWTELKDEKIKNKLGKKIVAGEIVKRKQLKNHLRALQ